jgi:serine/threonine-protein kinase
MIGQHIGNYRVTRLLGEGGMGQVFEAEHCETQQRAAVKVLHAEFSRDADVIRRFLNEALAVNVVRHPGLVDVLDSGTLPSGAAFIVMEVLDGEALAAYLGRVSRIPERAALRIAKQVSEALAAAHAQDVVHRDLQPDNIMLLHEATPAEGRRVKLLDFGLAKVAMRHQVNAVPTKDGTIFGTPAYMPPEQWMSATLVDPKSDVYALGVILFEMLAGRGPFGAAKVNQLMQHHMYDDAPDLQQERPSITSHTATLVKQMLSKARHARPSSNEVAQRIEAILAALPPPASLSDATDAPSAAISESEAAASATPRVRQGPAKDTQPAAKKPAPPRMKFSNPADSDTVSVRGHRTVDVRLLVAIAVMLALLVGLASVWLLHS